MIFAITLFWFGFSAWVASMMASIALEAYSPWLLIPWSICLIGYAPPGEDEWKGA